MDEATAVLYIRCSYGSEIGGQEYRLKRAPDGTTGVQRVVESFGYGMIDAAARCIVEIPQTACVSE